MTTLNESYVNSLKINRLTKTQLNNATNLSQSELYLEDPEFVGGKLLETTSDGNIVESSQTIPTVNNPTITITQGGVSKGSFTLNQSTGDTIALDAGGGSPLPSQTGHSGEFLTTDGTDASWGSIPSDSSKADTNAGNFNATGKSYLSGIGMPSNRYIDLTLGTSNSTYTMPANGYLTLSKGTTGTQYISLWNMDNGMRIYSGQVANNAVRVFIPALKGQVIKIEYNAGGVTEIFRFIYAEGEENV